MKKIRIILLLLLSANFSLAQQESHYTQFFENTFIYNPAAMGTSDVIDFNIGFRKQWTGIKGAPTTVFLSGHSPVTFKKEKQVISSFNSTDDMWFKNPTPQTGKLKHAMGGKLLNDNFGAFNRTTLFYNYAVQIPLNVYTNLSFGVGLGVSNLNFNQDKVSLENQADETYNQFVAAGTNHTYFDMEAGLYLYHRNFFVGYSLTQIARNKLYFGDDIVNGNLHMHHYFTAGYNWKIKEDFTLSPMAILKYMQPAPFSFDVAVKLDYKEWLWGAVSYRYEDAIGIMAGVNVGKMFQVSYVYDISIGKIRGHNGGSHEIMLGILIGQGKKGKNDGESDEENTVE